MRRSIALPLFVCLFATISLAASPRINFVRTVPAPHSLAAAERIAVIYAIGDNEKVTSFVEHFVDVVARAGTLRVTNAVENNQHYAVLDSKVVAHLRHAHPADVYAGVNLFTCMGNERIAEGSEHTVDGGRVRKTHHWIDAVCTARVDLLGVDGKRLFSYRVRGEGTSPRSAALTADEKDVAYEQAARYAAVAAAEEITPRSVRETVELDDTSPSFDEAKAMIDVDRLADARAIWESALRRHGDSAALNYNLGAVCEAMGDYDAARRYFEAAVRMSPKEPRYKNEFVLFKRRAGYKPALQ